MQQDKCKATVSRGSVDVDLKGVIEALVQFHELHGGDTKAVGLTGQSLPCSVESVGDARDECWVCDHGADGVRSAKLYMRL